MGKSRKKKPVDPVDAAPASAPVEAPVHVGISTGFKGVLLIGDPHLEGRQPGFRKDDYPRAVLKKLKWCLDYCRDHALQPVCLGDLFERPRDNPTWLIGELIDLLTPLPMIGIFGNHDCGDPQLNEHDSLSLLIKAGCYRLVSASDYWTGLVNGRRLVVAGSSYRQPIPKKFETRLVPKVSQAGVTAGSPHANDPPLVVWLTHHDIDFAGYDAGRFAAHEIENVEMLVNGHIHRRLPPIEAGSTTWLNPGNISRRSRSEANQNHVPSVCQITVQPPESEVDLELQLIEVPHEPFETVFHESIVDDPEEVEGSGFVAGMKELLHRRTDGGAGLQQFIESNIDQFDGEVATQIRQLVTKIANSEAD